MSNNVSYFALRILTLLFLSYPTLGLAEDVYKVGVVPQFEARKIYEIWQPLLKALNEKTGVQFELEGSPNIPEFEKKLLFGEFDFAYMNPFHLVLGNEQQGYEPIICDRSRKLSGILVVRKDSQIASPRDLDGKDIAFPAPNALGASLQMRAELTDQFGISFAPKYVRTHDSVYLNVMLGKTAAGGGVKKTLSRQRAAIQDALQIIHTTYPVTPHPLAVHPRVSKAVQKDVINALLSLAATPKGKSLFDKIPMKRVSESRLSDYDELKNMKLDRFYVAPD